MADLKSEGQKWSWHIVLLSSDADVFNIIDAVNRLAARPGTNRGSVIVACAQILAGNIAQAGPEMAPQVREGIMAMIDGYAMQVAVRDT